MNIWRRGGDSNSPGIAPPQPTRPPGPRFPVVKTPFQPPRCLKFNNTFLSHERRYTCQQTPLQPRTTTDTQRPARLPTLSKRAFVYLRVSSEGQVNTGYSRDGLSIDAQREAATDKAVQLGAEIVGEYSDPGKSAFTDLHRRTGFLEMLAELGPATSARQPAWTT